MRWWLCAVGVLYSLAAQDWQQGVRYTIRAELQPAEALLRVHTEMVYRNNSPDTLRELFVHLYWNIFAPGSYARQLARERRLERIEELPPVRVDSFVVYSSGGERGAQWDVDNTIVRLLLPRPLAPGDSVVVLSSIAQKVPPEGLRMGRYGTDFFIAQWFPSVCVYDRYGWHREQYLGTGEFYEEVADFEVELTLPGTYVVAHTGVLLNPAEVLPAEVVQRLEQARSDTAAVRIADFAAQPLQDSTPRTWRFRAQQVRTFAWAAVRRYLWDAQQWEGVLVHVLYPKQLEGFYRSEGLRASVHAVRYFSEHFGRYAYPNLFVVVGGTSGGMEYPGIVFIGRTLGGRAMAPITAGVIMHEIGHNWYPMMVNSNETEFGFQDEGFNTFITTLALEAFYGRWNMGLRVPHWLGFFVPARDERTENALWTIQWMLTGWDEPLLTRSDWYRTSTGYAVNSYPKTASLLFMLRGVMGAEAFAELMQEYSRRYRFRHVYPEDFARLAAEVASRRAGERVDLRWFFDQWFSQTPLVDYALAGLRNKPVGGNLWDVTVAVERRQWAVLPVDVELRLADGQRHRFRISAEEVLRGPARIERTLRLAAPAVAARVDPDTAMLLDINRLNNGSGFLPPVKVRCFVEALFPDPAELYTYAVSWQPALGFNRQDGLKLGLEVRGAYLGVFHRVKVTLLQGLRFPPYGFSAGLSWQHLLWQLPGRPQVDAMAVWQEGWWRLRGGARLELSPEPPSAWQLGLRLAAGYWQRRSAEYAFPGSPLRSGAGKAELVMAKAALAVQWSSVVGLVHLRGSLEPLWYREPQAEIMPLGQGRSFLRGVAELQVRPELPLPVVVRGVLGWFVPEGIGGVVPPLVAFRVASVSGIGELELPLYRSPGIVTESARQRRTAPVGGGFLRGYIAADSLGRMLSAVNVEVELVRFLFGLRLFLDGGEVGQESFVPVKRWRWDGGISVSMSLPSFGVGASLPLLERLGIDELALDFPLYLSHPPAGEKRWRFRWMVRLRSLQRAFVEW
jgi:hypothetical protein